MANSIRNIVRQTWLNLSTSVMGFVSRTVFINILGTEYLGINGVMGNVLSMLTIAELGMSTAIGFSLYKPLASGDHQRVSALMAFYRRAYMYIAGVVAVTGLVLLPFLPYLFKSSAPIPHLHLIYLIFLANTVASYFLIYPQTLIIADQKAYKTVPFAFGFYLLWTTSQIIALVLTRNYIFYLLTQSVGTFAERLVTNRYIKKCYPQVDFSSGEKLPDDELAVIRKNVGAMVWHRIGDFCVNGTSNLIISARLSVALVGLYSNYMLLIGVVNGILLLALSNVAPSFGNLIATEPPKKCLEKSRMLDFLAFGLFGWTAAFFYNLLNPFIVLWIGRDYLLSQGLVALMVLNYYLTGSRVSLSVVKMSGGIYAQDRYLPLLQAVVNLGISLLLAEYLGIAGVLLGMIISTYCFPFWYRSIIVYRHVFAAPVRGYFLRYALYLAVAVLNVGLTAWLCARLPDDGGWLDLAGRGAFSLVIPPVIILLLFWRSMEMKQLLAAAHHYRYKEGS